MLMGLRQRNPGLTQKENQWDFYFQIQHSKSVEEVEQVYEDL